MKVIELKDIKYTIGTKTIVDIAQLSIEKGCIYGLVGYNGAGKTSLLKILLGLNADYLGDIKLFESNDLSDGRKKIGSVLDQLTPDFNISAYKYLTNLGELYGGLSETRISDLLNQVGLKDVGKKSIGKYSLGMKKRLLLAQALIGSPKLLILDELFNGIDPEGMNDIRLILQELAEDGVTIFVTSHQIPELIKLVDHFGVMHDGRIIDDFSSKELENCVMDKLCISTPSVKKASELIKADFPQLVCLSDATGRISIFGIKEHEELVNILESKGIQITDVCSESMTEEEILLYKMDGGV